MKRITLTTAVLFSLGTASFAQKSWTSLTLNGYYGYVGKFNADNSSNIVNTKIDGISILPSLGYYRFIGKHWGLGAELGYRKYQFTRDDSYKTSGGDENTGTFTFKNRSLYFCPSIFENYEWNNFRGIASFSIPLEFAWDMSEESSGRIIYANPAQATIDGASRTEYPNSISFGFFGNFGIQRRITGNLFFGPQLGFGISNTYSHGEISSNTTQTQNGGTQERSESGTLKEFKSSFTFQPTISLCYYF